MNFEQENLYLVADTIFILKSISWDRY